MRENGWRRISIDERIRAINEFEQKKESMDIRDRKIAHYILYDNLSALAIYRKNDPDIICYGNRNVGKPLSASSILEVFYRHFPYLKKQTTDRKNDKRVELIRKRQKKKSEHVKQCAFCGSKEKLEEHHMIPLMMGGTNDERNLIFLCHDCHLQVTQYQMILREQAG